MNLNKVILGGRLTANPELKQTGNGVAVTSFTIAVDRKYSKDSEKKADFITIVAWRQTAEFICKYFTKGSAIIICGELQTRSWKDADGKNRYATEVVASEVSFAESKSASANISITAEEIPTQGNVGGHASEDFEVIDDDLGLPF
jgi:single-strand DNA-binding protein